ncbi:MAG: hypothetical protein M3Y72_02770 [Acidobacteriota bacterium]|nr:hypothetical protein [Acidobacteriota bacterium]
MRTKYYGFASGAITRRCLAIALWSASLCHPSAPKDADIWHGASAGFSVNWSDSDILITQSGKHVLSLRAAALREWHGLGKDANGIAISGQTTFRVLSLVDSVLSVEQERYCDCGGAHPSGLRRFLAIDLRSSTLDNPAPTLLSSWFSEREIFDALRSDPLVRAALKENDGLAPESLSALLVAVNYKTVQVGECRFAFKKDMLESFAFFSADPGHVKVRLSLSHAEESCRGQLTQIGIVLTPTAKLTGGLLSAGRSHDLMNELRKIAPGTRTVVAFPNK